MSDIFARLPWSWIWSLSIVLAWLGVAHTLGQPIPTQQHSLELVRFGAFKGSDLTIAEAWRLIASQWLHVKFLHMLFNALIIGLIGQSISDRFGAAIMIGAGVAGGAAGQLAGALATPDAYISGASQAYLALAGLALLTLGRRSLGWWAALVGIFVGVGLDVFVSDHGGIKIGHSVPFALGVMGGVLLRQAATNQVNRR
jgi:membrane associated rhomboid family serine protease